MRSWEVASPDVKPPPVGVHKRNSETVSPANDNVPDSDKVFNESFLDQNGNPRAAGGFMGPPDPDFPGGKELFVPVDPVGSTMSLSNHKEVMFLQHAKTLINFLSPGLVVQGDEAIRVPRGSTAVPRPLASGP